MIRVVRLLMVLSAVLVVMLVALFVDVMQQSWMGNPQVSSPSQAIATPELSPAPTQALANATKWFPEEEKPLANATKWFPSDVEIMPSATAMLSDVHSNLGLITTVTPGPEGTGGPVVPTGPTTEPEVVAASFTPLGDTFMHNVVVALNANNGALRRVAIAPGETFSFVQNLGPQPHWLPWKNVYINFGDVGSRGLAQSAETALYGMRFDPATFLAEGVSHSQAITGTASPFEGPQLQPTLGILPPAVPGEQPEAPVEDPAADPPPPDAAPIIQEPIDAMPISTTPEPEPTAEPTEEPTAAPPVRPAPAAVPVLGGGVCDLASRYVVAARPLLPDDAFQFKLHPNGLYGIEDRDAVSIWFEGRSTDLDLKILNTTERWLVFEASVDENEDVVTITAILQDSP